MVRFEILQQEDQTWDITFFCKRKKEIGVFPGYLSKAEAQHYAPKIALDYLPKQSTTLDRK